MIKKKKIQQKYIGATKTIPQTLSFQEQREPFVSQENCSSGHFS
jgi:hypothetical protein